MFKVWGLHKNLCMVPGSSSPTSSWRWGRTWWCWWSWWWCWSWPGHDDHGNATMTTIFSGKGELPQQVQETPTIFLKMLGLMILAGQSTMDMMKNQKTLEIWTKYTNLRWLAFRFIVIHNLLLESNYAPKIPQSMSSPESKAQTNSVPAWQFDHPLDFSLSPT